MKNLSFDCIQIKDGFWRFYSDLNRKSVVNNVYNRFEETGRFEALCCNWKEGTPNQPHIYWDSDVVKWMEGVAYILEEAPAPELEVLVDEMVDRIAEHQRSDGYFNSYFGLLEPENRFTRRDDHELYCAGHLMEAAIAYRNATGKGKFLDLMRDYIDLIYRVFYVEKSAAFTSSPSSGLSAAIRATSLLYAVVALSRFSYENVSEFL